MTWTIFAAQFLLLLFLLALSVINKQISKDLSAELSTYLTWALAVCPRTGTCAWLPRQCSLLDPGRTAVPWLFGCPVASEWASQDSACGEWTRTQIRAKTVSGL